MSEPAGIESAEIERPKRGSRRIYVASSWRNAMQPHLVALLREQGFEVYDFRNPGPGEHGFAWSEIDPEWKSWTVEQYAAALDHPLAWHGFALDFGAMQWADTVVMLTPCGSSAHLELGWAAGAGKRTAVLAREIREPELMVKVADRIFTDGRDLLAWLGAPEDAPVSRTVPSLGDIVEDLTLAYDAEHWFPFVENEDADITGPGHQDEAAFAAAVNAYDIFTDPTIVASAAWRPWHAGDISHTWVVVEGWDSAQPENEWRMHAVPEGTEGALPVTTLWNRR